MSDMTGRRIQCWSSAGRACLACCTVLYVAGTHQCPGHPTLRWIRCSEPANIYARPPIVCHVSMIYEQHNPAVNTPVDRHHQLSSKRRKPTNFFGSLYLFSTPAVLPTLIFAAMVSISFFPWNVHHCDRQDRNPRRHEQLKTHLPAAVLATEAVDHCATSRVSVNIFSTVEDCVVYNDPW